MTEPQTSKRSRMTWSAQERAEWLALFSKDGQTAADFCRSNGLSPATLSAWLRQSKVGGDDEGALVELPASARHALVERDPIMAVIAPNGLRVEINSAVDRTWLARWLSDLMTTQG
jgi:transposase-like protein